MKKESGESLKSTEYRSALLEARRLVGRVQTSNLFKLDGALSDCEAFFSRLRKESPQVYGLLKLFHKEALEAAFRKRAGLGAIIE